jgi:hypothetical protein
MLYAVISRSRSSPVLCMSLQSVHQGPRPCLFCNLCTKVQDCMSYAASFLGHMIHELVPVFSKIDPRTCSCFFQKLIPFRKVRKEVRQASWRRTTTSRPRGQRHGLSVSYHNPTELACCFFPRNACIFVHAWRFCEWKIVCVCLFVCVCVWCVCA